MEQHGQELGEGSAASVVVACDQRMQLVPSCSAQTNAVFSSLQLSLSPRLQTTTTAHPRRGGLQGESHHSPTRATDVVIFCAPETTTREPPCTTGTTRSCVVTMGKRRKGQRHIDELHAALRGEEWREPGRMHAFSRSSLSYDSDCFAAFE